MRAMILPHPRRLSAPSWHAPPTLCAPAPIVYRCAERMSQFYPLLFLPVLLFHDRPSA